MYIEQSIKPASPASLRRDSTQLNQQKETFHDIFQRTLNNKSNSRPPKIELTGILIPLQSVHQTDCSFKIETDQSEYLLRIGGSNLVIARRLGWEEVTVKGYIDPDNEVFEVEKITISNRNEPYRLSLGPNDLYFELDQYKKSISRKGVVDIAPDYLAS